MNAKAVPTQRWGNGRQGRSTGRSEGAVKGAGASLRSTRSRAAPGHRPYFVTLNTLIIKDIFNIENGEILESIKKQTYNFTSQMVSPLVF